MNDLIPLILILAAVVALALWPISTQYASVTLFSDGANWLIQ